MPRTDDDSWDLASSVGATATAVAAARAVASAAPDAIINDPFAAPLVRAVGLEFFTKFADGELPLDEDDDEADSVTSMRRFPDGMAARTRFFDEFFADAVDAGVRQAVILASGLDARGWRLQWPADMVVYEIDQPEVIAFKTTTLTGLGASPTVDLRTVAIDLRQDWPAALAAAGFDASRPTAWIAEGLLGYLPPDAQDRLIDQLTALSPAGSRFAVEAVPSVGVDFNDEKVKARMEQAKQRWSKHGMDLDFSQLVYLGDRAEVLPYLTERGWTATEQTANELLTSYGLEPMADETNFAASYISAIR
ncbi:class I SAM-dependent methyltransferase [Mycolicibacterium brumae]|uniref:S-adenosyl-L-methionine-dependent methyltransferase n=1 Tax=Mycolicibacterium brumae TaxID=85968 RepID=A0A2G5PH78_9MYCO|nr:class I SAM-dependent methyltransferase [Mycolicibacterium brumae]MCV7192318.1 class I SAM-dependent methyltransferase [Mycolicibacterium brumae]PIB77651.1 SAM-dependent methyltransferase [Mycolicibacterium brumae]RWA18680.1 hypothetical protein MBRU_05595 [Mycolicibacterium brumae DSM 44177]UWW10087.1 class I SAM-dependent methyltransferase [Mycolicibacterium brumae]